MDDGLGSAKGCGWAHAAIEKHRGYQPVRRAVLLDACAALKPKPSSVRRRPALTAIRPTPGTCARAHQARRSVCL